jgi:hypothetical protein
MVSSRPRRKPERATLPVQGRCMATCISGKKSRSSSDAADILAFARSTMARWPVRPTALDLRVAQFNRNPGVLTAFVASTAGRSGQVLPCDSLEAPMPIYRLEPRDLEAPHWARSWHRALCLVAAPTETKARALAAAIFDQVAKHEPGPEPLVNPWTDPGLVGCAETSKTPRGMKDGMIALPDGAGGWDVRGGAMGGTEV